MTIELDQALPIRQLRITQRLRERRVELGLTQKQVVTRLARCGLRTTNRALSSLEHGAGIEVAKLPALAGALDCSVTYLLGLTDNPGQWEPDSPLPASNLATRPRLAAADPTARACGVLGLDVPDRAVAGLAQRRFSTL